MTFGELSRMHLNSRVRVTRQLEGSHDVIEGSLRGVDHGVSGTRIDVKTFDQHLSVELGEHDVIDLVENS